MLKIKDDVRDFFLEVNFLELKTLENQRLIKIVENPKKKKPLKTEKKVDQILVW